MEVPGFIYYIIYSVVAVMLYKGLCWFLDPYFVYSRRSNNKDIELFINGVKSHTQGIPFLLRQETNSNTKSDAYIQYKEICDLSLVVPCYNEESRLPPMLEEHMSYIRNL